MSVERTNHEKAKNDLNRELENVLKAATALASNFTSQEVLPSEIAQNLCNVVEAIFVHGLRDPFFLKGSRYAKYPEPNFWPFVSKYSHRSITNQINKLNQIKTEIGKGRAWIRIVLNESSLEHYLQLLLSESKAMSQFYNDWGFLRDAEQVDRMLGFVKGLSGIPINAAINSSFLNSWTPSPLILAGLMTGKPIKVGSLQIHRKPSLPPSDPVEAGVSALDYIPTTVIYSPIPRNVVMTVGSVSDDDASSIYSHPSMLDQERPHPPSSSSPRDAQPGTQFFVKRRTKRPRRSSRSSSESNSQGTGKNSETSKEKESAPASLANNVYIGSLSTVSDVLEIIQNSEQETPQVVQIDVDPSGGLGLPVEEKTAHEETKDIKVEAASSTPFTEKSLGLEGCSAEKLLSFASSKKAKRMAKEPEETPVTPEEIPDFTEEPVGVLLKPSVSVIEEREKEEEESTDIMDDLEPCGINISSGQTNDDSVLGTSLHDELMSALSFETASPGNALVSSGAWTVPKKSCDYGDGDTSGVLSSSSGSSGIPVSFGQALRSAMEQHSPDEEEAPFYDSESQDEAESRKASQQCDIDIRLTTIPREIGLVAQDYRCPMCRKSIGSAFGFSKYEVCGVDGLYYCMDCIKPGGLYSIPSRVLHSWEWEQRIVSDRGRAFIEANLERPAFNIESLNPGLYKHAASLRHVMKLRERLQIVSLYLFNCRESIADDFKKRVHPRDYLYTDIHVYSFMDLQNVRAGNLEKQLNLWLKYAISHVMECVLCRQKGFVCEICGKSEVIYPFNTSSTHRCPDCFSVFHSQCAAEQPCPKCARRSHYEVQESAAVLPLD